MDLYEWLIIILFCLVSVLFGILYFLYNYIKAPYSNYPGPVHYPLIGSFIEYYQNKDRFYDWMHDLLKMNNNKMISFSLPMKGVYILLAKPHDLKYVLKENFENYHREPIYAEFKDLLGEGIFNVDGYKWRDQRKIASHEFSKRNLNQKAFSVFEECSDVLCKRLDKLCETNEVFDLQNIMFRMTMDSICLIAFGYNPGCLTSEEMPEFAKAIDWCTQYLFERIQDPVLVPKKILGVGNESILREKVNMLDDLCFKIIDQKRESHDDAIDILTLFMEKRPDEGDIYYRDVVFSFILAGRDTTASSLTWFFYEMCKNPLIKEKVINSDKKYIRNAFLETLRLHPPVPMDLKCAGQDDVLPDGQIIPAGAKVLYSPYIFGRSKDIWGEDVMEFKPERWESKKPTDYEFPSFNAGPRICLGKEFAIMEATTVIEKVFSRYDIELMKEDIPTYSVGITSFMSGGLDVRISHKVK